MLSYLAMINTEEERALFTVLYQKYKQSMYRCAYKILNDVQDAEDIVHDVFCAVAESYIQEFAKRSEASNRRFLFVCTRNRAITLARHKSKTVSLDVLTDAGLEFPSDRAEDEALEKIADSETAERIKAAILGINPLYGDALLMYFDGFSVKEIAKLFDEKAETVKKRIFRGKSILKDAVGMKGGEL